VRLVKRRHERPIEQVREENSLWYRLVSQRKRLRCGKGSLSTAFVPRGGVCVSTESQSVSRVEDGRGHRRHGELL
jgi:hypothetical protein